MDYALGDPRQHRGRWGHPEQSGSRDRRCALSPALPPMDRCGARRAARAL